MKILDYFYEEYVSPALAALVEFSTRIWEAVSLILLWITLPIWIVPYLIFRGKKGGE